MCSISVTFRTKKQAEKYDGGFVVKLLLGKTLKPCQYSKYELFSILALDLTVVSTGIYFKTMLQYIM